MGRTRPSGRTPARLGDGGGRSLPLGVLRGRAEALETNPLGARTDFTLDGLGRVVLEATTLGSDVLSIERAYDANGNVLSEKDRRGVRKAWTYDELDRRDEMRIVEGPAPGPTGVVGPLLRMTASTGSSSRPTWRAWQLVRCTTGSIAFKKKLLRDLSPHGRCFEEYEYDLAGNRTLLRDLGGFTETSVYDALNRATSFTDRAGRTRIAEFNDPEGSRSTRAPERDPFGLATAYEYDDLNREISRTVSLTGGGSQGENLCDHDRVRRRRACDRDHGPAKEPDQAGAGRARSASPAKWSTWTGWPWSRSSPGTASRSRRHRARSRKAMSGGASYEPLGRLRETEDALGRRARYAFDGGGLQTSTTDRRGVRTEMTHDNVGRLVHTAVLPSLTTVPWSASMTYLDQARRRIETDARGKETHHRAGRPRPAHPRHRCR